MYVFIYYLFIIKKMDYKLDDRWISSKVYRYKIVIASLMFSRSQIPIQPHPSCVSYRSSLSKQAQLSNNVDNLSIVASISADMHALARIYMYIHAVISLLIHLFAQRSVPSRRWRNAPERTSKSNNSSDKRQARYTCYAHLVTRLGKLSGQRD